MDPINKCSMCEQIITPSFTDAALLGPEVITSIGKVIGVFPVVSTRQRIQRLCPICYEDIASYITSHNEEPDYVDTTLDGENLLRTDRSEVE